jgi:DNA-binding transcriptional ArsR family regulator
MDAAYDLHAEVLKALATPRRLEIVHMLGTGPRDLLTLASGLSASEPSVSQHLGVLLGAARPIRGSLRYALGDPDVMTACDLMQRVLRRRLERMSHSDDADSSTGRPTGLSRRPSGEVRASSPTRSWATTSEK